MVCVPNKKINNNAVIQRNRFNNFQQRKYTSEDYDYMERVLLNLWFSTKKSIGTLNNKLKEWSKEFTEKNSFGTSVIHNGASVLVEYRYIFFLKIRGDIVYKVND